MAEALLKRSMRVTGASGPVVASAGLSAIAGRRADVRARRVAREFGVSLDRHRSRPLTGEMVARADLILAMDSLVEAELLARHPEARSRVRLLQIATPSGRTRPIEIADPFDGDLPEVRLCYRRLESALRGETAGAFREVAGPRSIQVREGAFDGAH